MFKNVLQQSKSKNYAIQANLNDIKERNERLMKHNKNANALKRKEIKKELEAFEANRATQVRFVRLEATVEISPASCAREDRQFTNGHDSCRNPCGGTGTRD